MVVRKNKQSNQAQQIAQTVQRLAVREVLKVAQPKIAEKATAQLVTQLEIATNLKKKPINGVNPILATSLYRLFLYHALNFPT